MYDIASTVLQQKIAQLDGVGQIFVGGSSLPAVRVELNPMALARYGIGLDEVRQALASRQRQPSQGPARRRPLHAGRSTPRTSCCRPPKLRAADRRAGATARPSVSSTSREVRGRRRGPPRRRAVSNGETAVVLVIYPPARRQHHRHRRPDPRGAAVASRARSGRDHAPAGPRSDRDDPRFGQERRRGAADLDRPGGARRLPVPAKRPRDDHPGRRGAGLADRDRSRSCTWSATASTTSRLMALTVATGFVVDDAIVVVENVMRHIERGVRRARGDADRRQGDRLHGAVDEHLAGGRVHPDPPDGRHRRTPLPRVRGGALGRGRSCRWRSRSRPRR